MIDEALAHLDALRLTADALTRVRLQDELLEIWNEASRERPKSALYLTHAIEECIRGAQDGGVGVVVYCRKEGRALGEVTKFLVYNARKRQPGGDQAATYFERTECVAGVQDARFQQLMPDVVHWLGLKRIDRFVSMSDMKHGALVEQGIEVVERVPIPDELIPADAKVEIEAKIAAGYFTDGSVPDDVKLAATKGRNLV